jgi:hypothetical protein
VTEGAISAPRSQARDPSSACDVRLRLSCAYRHALAF